MMLKRVVVTGIGALTPIGLNVHSYWDGLCQSVSGAAPITRFDASKFKTNFACELKNFNAQDYIDRKELRKLDDFSVYALISTAEAIKNSNLDLNLLDLSRCGVIWGSGIGGLNTMSSEIETYVLANKVPRFSPFFIPKMISDIAAGLISIKYGFRGPNFSTVSACASSTNSIIEAYHYIKLGKSDVMISGGSEASVNEAALGGFNALRALSTRNEEPSKASRPFDSGRDGFVLGEGAGTIILEEYEHAKKRGANIYCEVKGTGTSGDAYHLTAPEPNGIGAMQAMKNAIKESNLDLSEIDYINVHGTSTPLGDPIEIKAIKEIFKDKIYNLNISSTKSMTGHLLGAAGAIEAIASILAIKNSCVPPTINLENLDEQLDPKINYTANKIQKKNVKNVISNTFGFGGHNATVLLGKL
ncbi:MAG: beta-ketoacyl-ACP synthase II [Bacteroidota bacterium]|nr:beta-ketoacyl-ACP synthase II [Bacteroidota bacterium]